MIIIVYNESQKLVFKFKPIDFSFAKTLKTVKLSNQLINKVDNDFVGNKDN